MPIFIIIFNHLIEPQIQQAIFSPPSFKQLLNSSTFHSYHLYTYVFTDFFEMIFSHYTHLSPHHTSNFHTDKKCRKVCEAGEPANETEPRRRQAGNYDY